MSHGDFQRLEPGAQGPAGPTGATGATGATGPAGPAPTGSGNKVLATPADGSSGVSALRSIVLADLVAALATGSTAGQVLTSTGAASAPAMAAPITATIGIATLGSTFLITGSSGVYQDTGLTLSLPSTGRYLLFGRILGNVNLLSGSPGFISAKFRDTTAGADVANSQTVIAFVQGLNNSVIATAPMFAVVDVTGATNINLYAARNLATTYNASELNSTSAGYTQIGYIKIGP